MIEPSYHSQCIDQLLDAASELILLVGLDGLTAAKIAARVGLKRTVVHYHFGTMDHLLAALVRRSFANAREVILPRFRLETLGEDIWRQYSINMPLAEAYRARALASDVVGEAYREVINELIELLAAMLRKAHDLRGIPPEISYESMALTILMSAQFVGGQRALGSNQHIDELETYMKSRFAITKVCADATQ